MAKDHTIIVGGTKGTGVVIANAFAKKSNVVSVIGRTKPKRNLSVDFFELDLEKTENVKKVLKKVIDKNGKVKNLIFTQRYRGNEYSWQGELQVSVNATKEVIEYCTDKFEESGSIVIISSVASLYIVKEQPLAYHVAKAAQNKMVDYYAARLGEKDIRVNGILPGTIDKGLKEPSKNLKKEVPLKKMVTPAEIANMIKFLCSNDASGLTGQKIVMDGGVSLLGQESLIDKLSSSKPL
ncbi:SDR family oxidoreductase [Candidatus Woesearchaeota archaeon]|nr:SDR family oxidoreductase [Candidatus Woesearchaeota archaeon]